MNPRLSEKGIIALFLLFIAAGAADPAFAARPLNISPNNIPNGTVSTPYFQTLTASNGITPYIWSITAGSLPPGLTLTPAPPPSLTADISGTPFLSGTYNFTVTLRDSDNPQNATSQSYKVTVVPPCSFTVTDVGAVFFNNIDPSLPGPVLGTITQQIYFVCRNNMTYTVTANPASGWTINQGANSMPYTFSFNTGGVGGGPSVPIPLLTTSPAPQITQPNYVNAPGGLYVNNQAVTFTISWAQAGGGTIIATLPAGSVGGTVMNVCVVSQSAGTLTFNIDPSVAGSTSATITPDMQIQCTKNAGVTITASSACGGAAPRLAGGYPPVCGANTIPYTFNFLGSVTGQGFGGAGVSLGLGGSATSANYANAPVGNYGDQQTLTITY